jgi:coenzyme F420-reducing hydrogenase beta subunit
MRIDDIVNLREKCTGCMACVDGCPRRCINSVTGKDGFRYTAIDNALCIGCGRCFAVCPIMNHRKNGTEQRLFASYAKDPEIRNSGSSGGIFHLLAKYFLNEGYAVCGAAFDGKILKHRIICSESELLPLLKSKYVQSDTTGIFKEILSHLKSGGKMFFCGTPCQVSALKNYLPDNIQKNLFTADIICHGVPSQETFNLYIRSLEEKHKAKVLGFSFRVKDNRYKHAHGYSYVIETDGKTETVNGLYPQSSYYNAFKKYLFFRESCYDCRYTTPNRVSDVTLGDFWGIEKYDFKADTDAGVSLILTNTMEGETAFFAVSQDTIYEEFPVEYGIESNHCLSKSTVKPKLRDEIIEKLRIEGYDAVAKEFFSSGAVGIFSPLIPSKIRKLIRKLRWR